MPSDYDDDDDFYEDEEGFGEEDGFSEVNFDDDDESPDYGDEWSDKALGLVGGDDDQDDDKESEEEAPDDDAELAGGAADLLAKLLGGAVGGGEDPLATAAAPDDELAWRETYYVLFQRHERPTLTQVEAAIGSTGSRLEMENLNANDDGLFQSVLVQAPEDNAALEVSYEEGDAVMEQSAALAKTLQKQVDSQVLAQLLRADARLDVMHFERMDEAATFSMDEPDDIALEALNPATLLGVVEALASLTGGLAIDPAAGEVLL
ncbi:hypothetical protein Pla123a_16040 [Posidoniimonas polymericola]|uniref:Uncharacterized protein n=1 Tax=Posidoniimonas polymericola TaxID=2528002 RepID=A0A5C5YSC8_9BACT|nr:hypothetical protein [Posidoniimonas polymericola]TWT77808.1 hypothetical protein Pla123a_16040 [Posidoniimonas polymericola]